MCLKKDDIHIIYIYIRISVIHPRARLSLETVRTRGTKGAASVASYNRAEITRVAKFVTQGDWRR